MLKQFIRWTIHLMKLTKILAVSALLIPLNALAEEIEAPIEYRVTAPKGYYYGTVDGETAYKDWRRGTFDKERMIEVQPKDLPSNLPEPVIIPYVEPKVNEVPVGKPKQPPLKGEDKIFVQIGKDEKEARCFILGQGCEDLVEPEVKDSVYFRPIEALQEQQGGDTSTKKREIIQPE